MFLILKYRFYRFLELLFGMLETATMNRRFGFGGGIHRYLGRAGCKYGYRAYKIKQHRTGGF